MKKLSIIVPAHNEEKYIEETLRRIFLFSTTFEKEIIVVDDGSSDGTMGILEKKRGENGFILLKHEKNLGKGRAVKTGLGAATGDLCIIQDADLEYLPEDIPKLLEAADEEVSAVYGMRSARKWPKFGFHYVLGAKIMTLLVNILYGSRLHDVYTGYKLFNLRKVDMSMLRNLKSEEFEFEAEVTCRILEKRGIIREIPINYAPRDKKEGKHIGWKDAFLGVFTIFRCFLRNR